MNLTKVGSFVGVILCDLHLITDDPWVLLSTVALQRSNFHILWCSRQKAFVPVGGVPMLSDFLLLAKKVILEISRKGYFHSLSKLLLFQKPEWKHVFGAFGTFGATIDANIFSFSLSPSILVKSGKFSHGKYFEHLTPQRICETFFFFKFEHQKIKKYYLLIILVGYFININFNEVFALMAETTKTTTTTNSLFSCKKPCYLSLLTWPAGCSKNVMIFMNLL